MKTFFLTTLLALSIFFIFSEIQGQKVTPKSKSFPPDIIGDTLKQAQTMQAKLDQVELMKKYIGTWKCEMGKDTTMVLNFSLFGTALEGNFKVVTKDKTLNEAKKLLGYDEKNDILIECLITNSSPDIILVAFWFTSNNTSQAVLFQDISNPGKATIKWKEEFKSPDMFIQTYIENNKVLSASTFIREK
jgi:hypothetical protein